MSLCLSPRQFLNRVIFTRFTAYFLIIAAVDGGMEIKKWSKCSDYSARDLEVHDGDTIIYRREDLRMRIQNLDAPELDQPFGIESKQGLQHFLSGKITICEEGEDVYHRKLVHVWKGQDSYLEEALRDGSAVVFSAFIFPKKNYYRKLKFWENEARDAHKGIWSQQYFIYPSAWRAKAKKRALSQHSDRKHLH